MCLPHKQTNAEANVNRLQAAWFAKTIFVSIRLSTTRCSVTTFSSNENAVGIQCNWRYQTTWDLAFALVAMKVGHKKHR